MKTLTRTRWLAIPAITAATVRLLAGCSAQLVAGIDSHDAGGQGDASPLRDGSANADGAARLDSDGGGGASIVGFGGPKASAVCDPAVTWPKMLAGNVTPSLSAASLDLARPGGLTLAYGESINCSLVLFGGPPSPNGGAYGYWGANEDIIVSTDPTATWITSLVMSGSYTGSMTFQSRAGGSYGSHTYVVAMGKLDRDGVPFTIDPSNAIPGVNEVYDGLIATFAPSVAPSQNCNDSPYYCVWGYGVPSDDAGAMSEAGVPANAQFYFTVTPLKLAVGLGTAADGETPNFISLDFTAGAADGG
ncbi:MAG TPA: hypothetical protein VIF09_19610 [Polyangiaceae bacterium]